MAACLLLEMVADITKFRWVARGRPGGFCNIGVWRFSRHPNYFGEIMMWWCAWGLTLRLTKEFGNNQNDNDQFTPLSWIGFALLSPLTTMLLLLFISGLPFCEGKHLKRHWNTPGFQEYWRSTSILVPMPKALYKKVPMWMRRLFFCELRRYEYDERP